MRITCVIPARYQSFRLPGKCLLEIAGKPMIQWVYERSLKADCLDEVLVATDDVRIFDAVRKFDGRVMMTSSSHQSGTERVAEVATRIESDVFINVQGDEPLISPKTIDAVCQSFLGDEEFLISTARVEIFKMSEIEAPDNVKVVSDRNGKALYFSRHPIPYLRGKEGRHFKHLGIYGYRRELLKSLEQIPASELERSECLEQLRFLDSGISIKVVTVKDDSVGVDTSEDLERVRALLENLIKDPISGW